MRKIASLCTVLMLLSALAFGQTRTISGQVKDDKAGFRRGIGFQFIGQRSRRTLALILHRRHQCIRRRWRRVA